jgi:hypothetical protein
MFSDTMMLGGGGRKAAYSMENSLLFQSGQLLTRTPSVAGNRKTWTHSVWVRRSQLADSGVLFSSSASGVDAHWLYYTAANDRLYWQDYLGADRMALRAAANFRDPNAWYHIVIALDTTQAVASNRAKMYVNGEQITVFDQAVYPDQFLDLHVNTSGRPHFIGNAFSGAGNTLKAAIAEPVFIDGAALAPTHFGEFDPVTLSWRPKRFIPAPVSVWNSETSISSSQYSGNTGLFTFGNGTLDATVGTNGAIKLGQVFSGDFRFSFRWDTDVNSRMLQVGVMKKTWADSNFDSNNNEFGAYPAAYANGNVVTFQFTNISSAIYDTRNGGGGTANGTNPAAGDIITVSRAGNTLTMTMNGASINAVTDMAGDVQIGLAHSGGSSYYVDVSGVSWQFNSGDTGYGPNGFHLGKPWNSAGLGTDYSGRGNNWTPSSFVAADVVLETPTNVHSALNVLVPVTGAAFYLGDITIPSTGKWYWEYTPLTSSVSSPGILPGILATSVSFSTLQANLGNALSHFPNSYVLMVSGALYGPSEAVNGPYGGSFTLGDTIGIAFDADAGGKLYFSKGGLWGNGAGAWVDSAPIVAAKSGLNANGPYWPGWSNWGTVATNTASVNFGQRAWGHTPPAGFKSLCTANLPATTGQASGSFTGNANAEGPFVHTGAVPVTLTINGNAVTWGTHADKLAGGFKIRTASASYNASGTNNWTATYNKKPTVGSNHTPANAQANP